MPIIDYWTIRDVKVRIGKRKSHMVSRNQKVIRPFQNNTRKLFRSGYLILNGVRGDDFISYKIQIRKNVIRSDAIPIKVSKFWVPNRSFILCEFKLNRITFYSISTHWNIVGKRIAPLTQLRINSCYRVFVTFKCQIFVTIVSRAISLVAYGLGSRIWELP